VVTRVHDSPAMGEYRFELVRGDAQGVCAAVLPRDQRAGLHAYSVDHDGNLYQGPSCVGTPVDHFTPSAAGAAGEQPSVLENGPAKREDKPISPIEPVP
jgi:hypothetical protein